MTYRVLIAEDSPTQADVLRRDLVDAGYEVLVAHDGREALDRLRTDGADLLLSDIVMPGMDGFELCRSVKDDKNLKDLPVILLTSLRDPLDIIRGLEVGADNFLTKPYEAAQVMLRIQTMITSRQLRSGSQRMQLGVELSFMGRRFMVSAERQQILDLLVSTFEDLVNTNSRLLEREEQLAQAQDVLADQLESTETERGRLRAVLEAMPDALFIVDTDGVITDVNPAAGQLLKTDSARLIGSHVAQLVTLLDDEGRQVASEDWPILRAASNGEATVGNPEFDILFDGHRIPIGVTAAPVRAPGGEVVAGVGVVRDLSAAALTDPLTGLSSRSLFSDRLERALLNAQRRSTRIAVLRLALDRFTVVHDTLGREAESGVLAAVADRLRRSLREEATLARLGGDDFVILLEDLVDVTDPVRVAERVTEVVGKPFVVGLQELFLTASIGIAISAGGLEADEVLQQANVAMHRAVDHGGARFEVFDKTMSAAALRRLQLETDLRRAVEREELVVYYQPVVEIATGRVVECEALVRWQHPTLGLVPPDDFIPLAEETGLIIPAGMWILEQACHQARGWASELGRSVRVAVNLSARQFEHPELEAGVVKALEVSGLPASSLVLEITETAVIRDPKRAVETVQRLRALGTRIAIDDFGTGYSSLSYLRSFPVDVLKIDRSFTQRLGDHSQDTAIVQAVLTLGQSLGLSVTAEGVETVEQLEWLKRSGSCDLAAGYLFAKPLPPDEVALLLDALLPAG